jgi:hypothetical protein
MTIHGGSPFMDVSMPPQEKRRQGRIFTSSRISTPVQPAGDAYAYDIVLDEMTGNAVVWRKVLRTPWITGEGSGASAQVNNP